MKYARWERERRFLLAGPPADTAGPAAHIQDRYLTGTRLRLRLVQRPGEPVVRKLGQKIREPDSSPPAVAHTSLYLDAAEYAALAGLPAAELTKARTLLYWDGPVLAVDVFTDRLAGLVLAEYDLADYNPAEYESVGWPPVPILAEVTGDERFTGGALARTSPAELRELLASY